MHSQDNQQSTEKDYPEDIKRVGVKEDVRSAAGLPVPGNSTVDEDIKRVGVKEDVRSAAGTHTPSDSTADRDTIRLAHVADTQSAGNIAGDDGEGRSPGSTDDSDPKRVGVKEDVRFANRQQPANPTQNDQLRNGQRH